MKKTFHVKLVPSTIHGWDIEVEAESMSDAIKIAEQKHCAPRTVEVTVRPEWIQPKPPDADENYELYEYEHQVHDKCCDCGVVLFEGPGRPDNDWPWQYASADKQCFKNVCYPCAQKRKEDGNVCYYFGHYYRDAHHYGCDKCPPGDCKKAQERHYNNLTAILGRALHLSDAPSRDMVAKIDDYLAANEFGLAYEALTKCSSNDERDPRFAKNMEDADALMKRGWKTID